MPTPASFDYAILRVVPRVERQEFVNAGVVVFCREKRYLAARVRLDHERVKALWPEVDLDLIAQHLEAVVRICEGMRRQARLRSSRRVSVSIGWFRRAAPSFSPRRCHTGVCDGTGALLDRLETQFLA